MRARDRKYIGKKTQNNVLHGDVVGEHRPIPAPAISEQQFAESEEASVQAFSLPLLSHFTSPSLEVIPGSRLTYGGRLMCFMTLCALVAGASGEQIYSAFTESPQASADDPPSARRSSQSNPSGIQADIPPLSVDDSVIAPLQLLQIAANDNTNALVKILNTGVNPDALQTVEGMSALLIAVLNGKLNNARWLLAAGADLYKKTLTEQSVFDLIPPGNIALKKHLQLIDKIYRAVDANNLQQVEELLLSNWDIATIRSTLIRAKQANNEIILGRIKQRLFTTFIEYLRRGETAQALQLVADIEINMLSKNGVRPLGTAAKLGNLAVVKELLERGADINAFSASGIPALAFAAAEGNSSIVSELLARGANINAGDWSKSAIFKAVEFHQNKVVELLLQHTPPPDMTDSQVENLIKIAQGNGNTQLVGLLQTYNAKRKLSVTPPTVEPSNESSSGWIWPGVAAIAAVVGGTWLFNSRQQQAESKTKAREKILHEQKKKQVQGGRSLFSDVSPKASYQKAQGGIAHDPILPPSAAEISEAQQSLDNARAYYQELNSKLKILKQYQIIIDELLLKFKPSEPLSHKLQGLNNRLKDLLSNLQEEAPKFTELQDRMQKPSVSLIEEIGKVNKKVSALYNQYKGIDHDMYAPDGVRVEADNAIESRLSSAVVSSHPVAEGKSKKPNSVMPTRGGMVKKAVDAKPTKQALFVDKARLAQQLVQLLQLPIDPPIADEIVSYALEGAIYFMALIVEIDFKGLPEGSMSYSHINRIKNHLRHYRQLAFDPALSLQRKHQAFEGFVGVLAMMTHAGGDRFGIEQWRELRQLPWLRNMATTPLPPNKEQDRPVPQEAKKLDKISLEVITQLSCCDNPRKKAILHLAKNFIFDIHPGALHKLHKEKLGVLSKWDKEKDEAKQAQIKRQYEFLDNEYKLLHQEGIELRHQRTQQALVDILTMSQISSERNPPPGQVVLPRSSVGMAPQGNFFSAVVMEERGGSEEVVPAADEIPYTSAG